MRPALAALGLLLVAIAFVSVSSRSQSQSSDSGNRSIDDEMKILKNGTLCERMSAIIELHRTGKGAIPALISHISDTELAADSANLIANPILSSRPPESQYDYFAGALYAYIVELILGRATVNAAWRSSGSLWSNDPTHCDFPLDPGDYPYSWGVVRRKDNRPIAASDLPRIKETYSNWWGTNGKKTLPQLQQDWKHHLRPLRGSEFSWR
jgi:hypothetical protein